MCIGPTLEELCKPFGIEDIEELRAGIQTLREFAAMDPDEPLFTELASILEFLLSELEPLAGETKTAT